MEQLYKDFLSVIKCGILEQEAESRDPLYDWKGLFAIAHRHRIHMMLYYGIIKGRFVVPEEVLNVIKNKALSEIAFSMRQRVETDAIFKEFEKNEIEFLPLKGTVMKKLYPEPDMRLMSDVDILIREEQYEKIEEIMKENHFSFDLESDHELVWKKKNGVLCVELHKRLVPTYNKDFYAYYGDGWKTATKCEGTHYYMSDEDFFVYMFLHFAKHYRDSGIGLRHIIDLWVCLKDDSLDYEYVEEELKKLSLYNFYVNIKKTFDVWFEEAEETEETEIITKWIFESGVYGTAENNAVSRAVRKEDGDNSKIKTYFRAFFPSYVSMRRLYPTLKKVPVLLPVFWIWRLIERAFSGSDRLKKINEDMKVQTEDNKSSYKELLDKVGLKL